MSALAETLLLVFDFDWSFIDEDSDLWTARLLPALASDMAAGLHAENTTSAKLQWTDQVAAFMVKLCANGTTRAEIEENLRGIPFNPAMARGVQALKQAESPATTLFLLSNANTEFIRTILAHHNLSDLFDEIVSNPATWESDGCLRVQRRTDPTGPQHNCNTRPRKCSPNMCKGLELDAFVERRGGWSAFSQVAYVGDGSNDLCPILRLRSQDLSLVRSGRELAQMVYSAKPKCKVIEWKEAEDLEKILEGLHLPPGESSRVA